MYNVVLCRVDKSLINAVILSEWCSFLDINTVYTIDDEFADNDFVKMAYDFSTPDWFSLKIFSKDQAIDKFKNTVSKRRIAITARKIKIFKCLFDSGIEIKSIFLSEPIYNSKGEINYTAEDIGIINYLINSNVEIYYQEFYSSKKERIAPIKE